MSAILLLLASLAAAAAAAAVRVYPYLPEPKENPDFERFPVPHPSLDVFSPVPQFATLRTIPVKNSHIDDYQELIELFLLDPNTTLGGIVWPRNADFLFADNFKELVDYIKGKGLYMTSVHGFTPVGAGYRPPRDSLDYLEESLGDRWFGIANGEQDGHYFRGFIHEELPLNNDHRDQYINFRDYFRETEIILGPRLTTLLSSTYPHYQLKSGLYTIAGAESSQGGPNAQLRYAFIRGAGKQYGVLWFGNVSVYGGFGHKVYVTPGMATSADVPSPPKPRLNGDVTEERNYVCVKVSGPQSVDIVGDPAGPTCGTSLNLMKRLMYAQMMYNSGYVSFEGNWFYKSNADMLSPIGLIQHNAYLWTKGLHSVLGVHTPTVGLYLDFFNGWAAPRLQRGTVYRAWGNLLYAEGDYYTDNLLRMIYPSYQDAPYFHDESGVSSPTPYGDFVDVLLSDAPSWVLKMYDTIVLASEFSGGLEVEDSLKEYLGSGGNLVLTAGNLATLPSGSLGISTKLDCTTVQSGAKIIFKDGSTLIESYNMSVCDLKFPQNSTVLARLSDSTPLAVQMEVKDGGTLTVFATPFGVSSSLVCKPSSEIDKSLCTPYPLLDHVERILDSIFTNAAIIQTTANLSVIPTLIDKDIFNVLVTNPELKQQPLKILSPHGSIVSISEIKLDQSEKDQIGYLPDGFEGTDIGKSSNTTIAGVDTRLFRVELSAGSTKPLPKIQPKPRPRGIALHIRHMEHSIRHEILHRPTFFQHFDSVFVDFSYLITKDSAFLKEESKWLKQQGVSVYVDASSSINLFPTLRLTDDAPDLFNKSKELLTSLLHKMYQLGSQDLVVSLHISPSGLTKNQTLKDFNDSLHYLLNLGSQLNITLHMLDTPKNELSIMQMLRWLKSSDLTAIKLVLNLAQLVDYGYDYKYDVAIASNSSLLYINAPGWDEYGMSYAYNVAISKANATGQVEVTKMLQHICSLRVCPYQKTKMDRRHFHNTDHHHSPYMWEDHNGQAQHAAVLDKRETGSGGAFYPVVMDAVFENYDDEFADVHFIEKILL